MRLKHLQPNAIDNDHLFPEDMKRQWALRRSVFGSNLHAFALTGPNALAAWFFLYETRMGGQKLLMEPPFLGASFTLHTESDKIESRQTRVKQILRAIAEGLRQMHPTYMLDFSLPPEIVDIQPFLWNGFRERVRYTYLANLAQPEEDLLKAMSTARRKNIRDAENHQFKVQINCAYPEVVALVKGSFERQNHSWHQWVLENLLNTEQAGREVTTVLVSNETTHLAAAVFLAEGCSARYLFGGYNSGVREHTAGPLAMWTGIKLLKQSGVERFDFDGSMVPEIEKYFRAFGGTLHPYFTLSLAPNLRSRFIRWWKSER